jgi:hypothetical protein
VCAFGATGRDSDTVDEDLTEEGSKKSALALVDGSIQFDLDHRRGGAT